MGSYVERIAGRNHHGMRPPAKTMNGEAITFRTSTTVSWVFDRVAQLIVHLRNDDDAATFWKPISGVGAESS